MNMVYFLITFVGTNALHGAIRCILYMFMRVCIEPGCCIWLFFCHRTSHRCWAGAERRCSLLYKNEVKIPSLFYNWYVSTSTFCFCFLIFLYVLDQARDKKRRYNSSILIWLNYWYYHYCLLEKFIYWTSLFIFYGSKYAIDKLYSVTYFQLFSWGKLHWSKQWQCILF